MLNLISENPNGNDRTYVDNLNLTKNEIKMLKDWIGFFSFKPTWAFNQLIHLPHRIIGLFTGNQAMKTSNVAFFNVMSILGLLPLEHKNIRPTDAVRILRFASETLPKEEGVREVMNTQYPELLKWLPASLIKQDITQRSKTLVLRDPQGGDDIIVEFVSFGQDVQQQAGVQRRRVWIDEHAKKAFYYEQLPRLFAVPNADVIITLTPAQEHMDWEYDEVFERASLIIRTPAVRQRNKERYGEDKPAREVIASGNKDIAVLMAATDDNPTIDKDELELKFSLIADDDVIDIRRYGLFRQISGRILSQFDKKIHVIPAHVWFKEGIPQSWLHARGIDYHEQNNWAIGWASMSPQNEVFVWQDWYPSPRNLVTSQVALELAQKSGNYKFRLDLIDPLAEKKQSNTGRSVLQDLNDKAYELRKDGVGTGAYWQSWDTKNLMGREDLKNRLANAKECKLPFNNKREKNGRTYYLPTIWILDTCKYFPEFMASWRKEEWSNRETTLIKDPKDKPEKKWSHFPMVLEGLLKSPAFTYRYALGTIVNHDRKKRYFQGRDL